MCARFCWFYCACNCLAFCRSDNSHLGVGHMPNRFLPMKKAHLSSLDDDSDPHNYFFRLIKNSILSARGGAASKNSLGYASIVFSLARWIWPRSRMLKERKDSFKNIYFYFSNYEISYRSEFVQSLYLIIHHRKNNSWAITMHKGGAKYI